MKVRYAFLFLAVVFAAAPQSFGTIGPAFEPPPAAPITPGRFAPVVFPAWAGKAHLAVSLDQHLYPVLLPLVRDFEKKHAITVAVQEGTCGISAGSLHKKEVNIAGFCCPPGPGDRLDGLKFHTVGISGLAILVNRANPVTHLSSSQVRDLFSGAVRNWNKLTPATGPQDANLAALAVARLHCKARPGHWRLILDNEELFGPRVQEVGTIRDMLEAVAGFAGAIGFEVPDNLRRFGVEKKVKFVHIDNASPVDADDLARHRYPFYRTYNITTWTQAKAASKKADQLAEFLVNNLPPFGSGHAIVSKARLQQSGWKFHGNELVGPPAAGPGATTN